VNKKAHSIDALKKSVIKLSRIPTHLSFESFYLNEATVQNDVQK
jgi:hypothetical protein